MPTLRAPGAPVTSASPTVTVTASTLPAANASMDGAYSNQSNLTSTPASLNQPFWIAISNAVHPGQSLYAMRSGGLGAGAGGGGGVGAATGAGGGASVLQAIPLPAKPARARASATRVSEDIPRVDRMCLLLSGAPSGTPTRDRTGASYPRQVNAGFQRDKYVVTRRWRGRDTAALRRSRLLAA